MKLAAESPQGWIEKSTMEGMEYYYNADTEDVSWEKPDALKSPDELEEAKGDWVWIPHPVDIWQPARKLKTKKDGTTKFKTAKGETLYINVPESTKKGYFFLKGSLTDNRKQKVPVPLWPLRKTSLKFDEEDLVGLDSLNEALISHNLRSRYKKDALYTWVGAGRSVLVSINPYKQLPLYTPEKIDVYHTRPPNQKLAPHVFDISHDSYQTLMYENRDQAVLISGESGAGKTEATKQCLSFFAKVAGSETGVENKILVCNPLLEAFGNAKTIRNINSSRFGKWIEIHFNKTKGHIIGAKITDYLLERSRVVFQQANERNFHIFYQMCSDDDTKAQLHLGDADSFSYLNQSGIVDVEEIDDAADFAAVKDAMSQLEFADEEQTSILRLTGGVLHLGNVKFDPKDEPNNVAGSSIATTESLNFAAELLDVPVADLERVLCYRSISAKGDKAVIPLKPRDARFACDSLAKGIYGKLFSWLVTRVNESIEGQEGRFVGVLDIFGFEIFDNNSFEQLCINFANEKLQQDFNRNTFKEEEALYVSEGIDFEHIEFIDNQVVLDLVEGRPSGILPLLDDECIVPEGNDARYMNKLEKLYKKHPKFQTDKHRKLQSSLSFEIEHYAGIVKYNAAEFMVKNVDTLFHDMYQVMASSKGKLTEFLFPILEERQPLRSVSNQFRRQLNILMDVLTGTDSRYIRCVKPNDNIAANEFVSGRVIEQLRYSGVFEAVEIRKKGYPFRLSHKQFACKYSCINRGHSYNSDGGEDDDWAARCQEILDTSKQDFSDVKIGRTKVLYRAPEYRMLTLLHHLALETIVPQMQASIRGGIAREFKRRINVAEAGLQAALDQGNDIEMVKTAIEAVPEILGTMVTFWDSYPPRNLAAAEKLQVDLQKWLDLQQEMEDLVAIEDFNTVYMELQDVHNKAQDLMSIKRTDRQVELCDLVVELLDKCVLGKIDKAAEAAWESRNHEEMKAVVADAAEHDHTSETLELIKKELLARSKIDARCKEAVKTVDLIRMQSEIADAAKHQYSSTITKEAEELVRLFETDEAAFVTKEMEYAEANGDEARKIHREIRLKELKYEANGESLSPYSASGLMRDPEAYAKGANPMVGMIVGKTKIATGMLTFQKPTRIFNTIPAPLTVHPSESAEGPVPPEVKQFKRQAKLVFKSIMAFMGDKSSKDPDAEAIKVLTDGQQGDNHMRLEIYHQIIKQLTDNPNEESLHRGFQLLAMCISTFPPPEEFEDRFVVWIRNNAPSNDFRPYISTLHNTQYDKQPVTVDLEAIRSAFQSINGSRFSLPPGTKYTGPTGMAPEL